MSKQFTLNVSPRASTGRSASRRLRKTNQVPAILYGKHTKPETLAVDGPEFTRLVKAIAGTATLIELKRNGGNGALSFLQEVQRDPITDRFLHVDLQEVKADEKMEIRVRLSLVGESFGVKNQSGVLETPTQQLRIRCLPKDLPPLIEVDVTELKVGETIHVGELKAIPGVDYLDAKNQPVVSCVEPVAEEVVVAPEATAAAGAAAIAAGAAAPAAGGAAPAAGAAAPAAGDAKAAAPAAGGKKPAAPAAGGDKKPAAPGKK
jgi:large subunit ribosomal protein L25